jgi:hypothetical protein
MLTSRRDFRLVFGLVVSGIFDLSDGVKKVKLGSGVNGVMVVVVFKTVG